jgi:Ca2+-binding EF-hand superfamily protein
MAAAVTWRSIGSALAVLLVVAVVAGCGTGGGSPFASATAIDREFLAAVITWDLNRDGDVTCEEWKAYVADLFREADANRDGVLTREEFAVMARRDRLFETAGFSYFDGNGDGRLTLAEIADKPNPTFTLLDTNGDCRITPEERAGPPKGKQ